MKIENSFISTIKFKTKQKQFNNKNKFKFIFFFSKRNNKRSFFLKNKKNSNLKKQKGTKNRIQIIIIINLIFHLFFIKKINNVN